MDALARQATQRLIHQPLPRQPAKPFKRGTFHQNRKMRFARSVIAGMAVVPGTVIHHLQPRRGERGGEAIGNFPGDRAGGGGCHRAYIHGFAKLGSAVAQGSERKERATRFHGRVEGNGQRCMAPGCALAGEFRAPPEEGAPRDGPPRYRWFCLDHVRAFNARYNFFAGMSPEEISAAQRPYAGWERETRAFAHVGADRPPSWGDFADPLDAIAARFRERRAEGRAGEREDGKPLSEADRRALEVLGLGVNSDRTALRRRYAELARRYHPDRNGGDRTQEARLQAVIAAYQQLRRAPAFA